MSVYSVTAYREGNRGNKTINDKGLWETKYTRAFTVLTTDSADDEGTVFSGAFALGLPAAGSTHPNDASAYVQSYDVDRIGPYDYRVRVNYSSLTPDSWDAVPWLRDPIWRGDFSTKINEPMLEDLDGLLMANAADDPFVPVYEVERSLPTFTCDINKQTFSFDEVNQLVNTCNDAGFTILGLTFPKYSLKLNSASFSYPEKEGQYGPYFKVTYNMSLKLIDDPDYTYSTTLGGGDPPPPPKVGGWYPTLILNSGFNERSPDDPFELQPIKHPETGQPISHPALLTTDGYATNQSGDDIGQRVTTPNYIERKTIAPADWTNIP